MEKSQTSARLISPILQFLYPSWVITLLQSSPPYLGMEFPSKKKIFSSCCLKWICIKFTLKKKCTLTVWIVAVHIPSFTFVQPISVVNNADLPKATVGTCFDDGVANTTFFEPSSCTHMETWTEQKTFMFYCSTEVLSQPQKAAFFKSTSRSDLNLFLLAGFFFFWQKYSVTNQSTSLQAEAATVWLLQSQQFYQSQIKRRAKETALKAFLLTPNGFWQEFNQALWCITASQQCDEVRGFPWRRGTVFFFPLELQSADVHHWSPDKRHMWGGLLRKRSTVTARHWQQVRCLDSITCENDSGSFYDIPKSAGWEKLHYSTVQFCLLYEMTEQMFHGNTKRQTGTWSCWDKVDSESRWLEG